MKIKNWREYQHYKHRSPPWIKLHRTLLDDPEWHALDGDASKLLAMCWLVAADRNGELPTLAKLAFRIRRTEASVSSNLAKLSHWIEFDASELLAPCLQPVSPEESRGETEGANAPSDEKQLFDRGVQILGPKSRGLIAKLLKSKNGSIPMARSALEQASIKSNPHEYIGAIIRGPASERNGPNDPHAGML